MTKEAKLILHVPEEHSRRTEVMSNFGKDARESTVKHLTKTTAAEIVKKIKNWVAVEPTRISKRWPFGRMQNACSFS